jgi:hypothetical protein
MKRVEFTPSEIKKIEYDYLVNGLSCKTISEKYGVSVTPIKRVLRKNGKLRNGNSDGKKKNLTENQYELIKKLYLNEFKNIESISQELNINKHLVAKIIHYSDYRRTRGEAMSIYRKGRKLSESIKNNMKIAQQKFAKSGNRKQTGGICKNYIVDGLECQGTYEKFYIEKLINDGELKPKKSLPIETPFGVYYPDFSFEDRLIEIKCDYTYDILLGNKESRFTKQKNLNQYNKIKWVNSNIKKVDILIVDKRNNKVEKKEII